jgi:predicted nucleotidyltransferase
VICVGSGARGDWGVGSDLDVIVILNECGLAYLERMRRYEPKQIPVPTDLWVYTRSEWDALSTTSPHLWRRLNAEALDLLH